MNVFIQPLIDIEKELSKHSHFRRKKTMSAKLTDFYKRFDILKEKIDKLDSEEAACLVFHFLIFIFMRKQQVIKPSYLWSQFKLIRELSDEILFTMADNGYGPYLSFTEINFDKRDIYFQRKGFKRVSRLDRRKNEYKSSLIWLYIVLVYFKTKKNCWLKIESLNKNWRVFQTNEITENDTLFMEKLGFIILKRTKNDMLKLSAKKFAESLKDYVPEDGNPNF